MCASFVPFFQKGKEWLHKNPYTNRYLEDVTFKLNLSLHISLGINLLYAGMNGFSGFYYRSIWFGTLSVYYLFLSVMRFLLVRYAHKNRFGTNKQGEWKRYRLCGSILMGMNLALAGVVILVLHQNQSFVYSGNLIYAMALSTFYVTIMAVVNLVKYRKYESPVMSAARAVNLAAALCSMLSLETAMLTQFSDETTAAWFRPVMIGATGGAVCLIIVGTGLYMVVRSSRALKKQDAF